ncbi:MAG: transcription elongation factor GreA [Dehalococcoidia bacterium]|nr:transcription elongation factor GreA [Dehalococcoidia bacterium]
MDERSLRTGTLENVALAFLAALPSELRKEQQLPLNRFIRWMGRERSLGELTPPNVAAFAESALASGITDGTRLLQPVRDFLVYAKKEGFTSTNLATHIKLPKASLKRGGRRAGAAPQILLTPEGHQKLQEQIEGLKAERPRMAEAIRLARADGDIKENVPYHAAKEQQGLIESKLRELEATLTAATIMSAQSGDGPRAALGAIVVVLEEGSDRELRYRLVAPYEARPAEGRISVDSPLGKSLVDRAPGELVEVAAPGGVIRYRLARVER